MNVNSLLPHDANANQNAVSIQLEKKWEKTGLLEGISNEVERKGMAVLLENQAKQLVSEASSTGTGANDEQWSGVALPLVRRIFAEIAAKDFVSVQPMNLPSGLVFYLDFKYGTKQGTAGTAGGNDFTTTTTAGEESNSVFGVTNASNGTSAATEGLYGAGRFGYSINDVTSSVLTLAAAVGTAGTAYTTGSVSEADFNYNSAFSASIDDSVDTQMMKITIGHEAFTTPDADGRRGFNLVDATATAGIVEVYPEFTKLDANGDYCFIVKTLGVANAANPGTAARTIKAAYHKAPGVQTRGDFEDANSVVGYNNSGGSNLDIPEINLEMRSEAIVAKTRKLKAVWSPEFAQDLNAYHSIDAEAELTSMLSEYVSQEIDLEILDMLMNNAQTTAHWSARIGYKYDGTSAFAPDATLSGQAYNQGTWFQTLGTQIQKVSNKIHQLTLRGGANFLICSPTVATVLESIPGYAADTDGDKAQFAMGVQKVGAINNRFQVYKNPYMTENAILMGYRGSQFLETGAVYSPYIPLIMTPLVYDPNNFTPRKGVMTRYAKKMVRPEFYGKVLVHGLNQI